MRIADIIKMAIHNMRRRWLRTLLNLLGIVLGTAIILMTTAGTSGVKTALNSLFENSDLTRKVIVRRGQTVDETMLDESEWRVSQPMSDRRRNRLEESVKESLLRDLRAKKGRYTKIDAAALEKFEAIEHARDAVPHVWLRFQMKLDDFSRFSNAEAVSPNAVGLDERLVAGEMIEQSDTDHVLLHELLAHEMGYTTKEELNQLVGRDIDVTFEQQGRGNDLASLLMPGKDGLQGKQDMLGALGAMVENLDLSNLTEEQKKLIRSKLNPAVKQQTTGALQVNRKFVVKGIYHSLEEDLFSIFQQFTFDSHHPVLFHHKTATELQASIFKRNDFRTATVLVDSYRDIDSVSSEIESLGYETISVKGLLRTVERRIDQIGRVIYIIALIILAMTVFAISNTLIISVMERTAEFGIMKSLGAKSRHVVGLMVVEGALLGAIGAGIAITVSWLLARFGQVWLRSYIEGRVNQTITSDVFSFSLSSVMIAFAGAVLICSLASIIPAWRAARLDPIVAMQRK